MDITHTISLGSAMQIGVSAPRLIVRAKLFSASAPRLVPEQALRAPPPYFESLTTLHPWAGTVYLSSETAPSSSCFQRSRALS